MVTRIEKSNPLRLAEMLRQVSRPSGICPASAQSALGTGRCATTPHRRRSSRFLRDKVETPGLQQLTLTEICKRSRSAALGIRRRGASCGVRLDRQGGGTGKLATVAVHSTGRCGDVAWRAGATQRHTSLV